MAEERDLPGWPKKSTRQTRPSPTLAIRHSTPWETLASRLVVGSRHRHFLRVHPMAHRLGNQHAVSPALAHRDEFQQCLEAAVSSQQGHSA